MTVSPVNYTARLELMLDNWGVKRREDHTDREDEVS